MHGISVRCDFHIFFFTSREWKKWKKTLLGLLRLTIIRNTSAWSGSHRYIVSFNLKWLELTNAVFKIFSFTIKSLAVHERYLWSHLLFLQWAARWIVAFSLALLWMVAELESLVNQINCMEFSADYKSLQRVSPNGLSIYVLCDQQRKEPWCNRHHQIHKPLNTEIVKSDNQYLFLFCI